MASSLLDACRFNPTLGGTTDWTYSSAVVGYQSPAAAGVINGALYSYRAESSDLSQWEIGTGTYNTGTGVLARTRVLFNSSGGTSKITFSTIPQVAIVALAEDLATPAVLRGYLSGLILSTAGASATFGVSVGVATDSTNVDFMALASAYTKTTSAWAVGTAAGALDTGAIAASTWYHVHLIKRVDTGVVDVLLSLSASAPTLPASYTLFRRIGSIRTTGASQWLKFVQLGDDVQWDAFTTEVNGAAPGDTLAHTVTLSAIPTGIQVIADLSAQGFAGTASDGRFYVSSLDKSDEVATFPANVGAFVANLSGSVSQVRVRTNTSAQIRYRMVTTTGQAYIITNGYTDTRGKLS